jgi:hypothetical protein
VFEEAVDPVSGPITRMGVEEFGIKEPLGVPFFPNPY